MNLTLKYFLLLCSFVFLAISCESTDSELDGLWICYNANGVAPPNELAWEFDGNQLFTSVAVPSSEFKISTDGESLKMTPPSGDPITVGYQLGDDTLQIIGENKSTTSFYRSKFSNSLFDLLNKYKVDVELPEASESFLNPRINYKIVLNNDGVWVNGQKTDHDKAIGIINAQIAGLSIFREQPPIPQLYIDKDTKMKHVARLKLDLLKNSITTVNYATMPSENSPLKGVVYDLLGIHSLLHIPRIYELHGKFDEFQRTDIPQARLMPHIQAKDVVLDTMNRIFIEIDKYSKIILERVLVEQDEFKDEMVSLLLADGGFEGIEILSNEEAKFSSYLFVLNHLYKSFRIADNEMALKKYKKKFNELKPVEKKEIKRKLVFKLFDLTYGERRYIDSLVRMGSIFPIGG